MFGVAAVRWVLLLLLPFYLFGGTEDLIEAYCDGKTPCLLCTDGQRIEACEGNLCPIGRASCVYDCAEGTVRGDECVAAPEQVTDATTCSSWGYAYAECPTPYPALMNVWVKKKFSKAPCVKGYSYGIKGNKVWVDHGCRAEFGITALTCPEGFNYEGGECTKNASLACPLGNYPCIESGGGYYCSPYSCVNPEATGTEITDTPQGINDKKNDAPVTEEGCLGTIYIMNGRDMRCRPPGVQTGFSDCCKKTTTWFGLGRCSETERQLAALRSWGKLDGNCHYVGEYCAEKWLGVCVQRKKTYCCFSSPLARIIHEYGRPQLGIGWGDPKAPNCRGFTPEEFQKLDFSKIDFSEYVEEEVQKNLIPKVETSLENVLNSIQGGLK